jgi:hypothetical protein
MTEYEAKARTIRDKTARLKALLIIFQYTTDTLRTLVAHHTVDDHNARVRNETQPSS